MFVFRNVADVMEIRGGKQMSDTPRTDACSRPCVLRKELNNLQAYADKLGATNTEIRRKLDEAEREIAKLKASSNENYWELSRQRGNMLHALHKIDDAVRYGFKHGSKSGEEVK